jgi:hypothetical protein
VIAGILRQIEAVLTPASSLADFTSLHENGNTMETWAFACRYRLESVLKGVEAERHSLPFSMLCGRDEGVQYACGLPSSSADLALASLARMLHDASQKLFDRGTSDDKKGWKIETAIDRVLQRGGLSWESIQALEEAKGVAASLGP